MATSNPSQSVHVFITGVSAGIGRALVETMLTAGHKVSGVARRRHLLKDMEDRWPNFLGIPADITDAKAMTAAITAAEMRFGEINQAILNAGVYEPQTDLQIDPAQFRQQMDINYMGQVHALAALLPGMEQRHNGHIVIMASVAGWRGLPLAASYAPTKAASIALAESLRFFCHQKGIKMQVACPGFVKTEATAKNTFAMPMIMTPEDAANALIKGMRSQRFLISFPFRFQLMMKILRLIPYRWYFWLTGRMTGYRQ
jgi:NADP-dependent 3-hydroxy acid dehydrogenase YdfG